MSRPLEEIAAATPAAPLSLKRRALTASGWSAAGFAASQGIRLLTTLVMTRFLAPDMFGVMAIAVMVNVITSLLTDLGVKQNIIQSHRGEDPVFLDTAWTVQIVRGGIVWGLALLVALALVVAGALGLLPAGTVYAAPILSAVLAVSSFSVVISGFQSTRAAMAERSLNQRTLIQIELACQVAALLFMVSVGAATHSIWALVGGQLVASVVGVSLTHAILPGHPNRFAWDRGALAEIIGFGKWIFVSSFIGVFALNADRIVLGGVFTPSLLGQFAIATALAGAVQGVFAKLYSTILMPVLSETARLQRWRLKEVFYRIRVPTDLALLFCAGLLASSGSLIVRLLYDRRYGDAGWMLEILAFSLVWARYGATQELYLALGKPRYVAFLNFARFGSVFAALFLGLALGGAKGAIWGFALHQVAIAAITYRFNAILGLNDFARDLGVLVALPIGYAAGEALQWLLRR